MTITLSDLFAQLDTHEEAVPIDQLCSLLEQLDLTIDDVREYVSFNPDHYQRNLVHLGPGYAALILCWAPGQSSSIHDHRGSACGVLVLQGTVAETKYKRDADGMLTLDRVTRLPVGQVCGSYDSDIHTIVNEDPNEGLVTLHVYTPPMENYRVYHLDSAEVEVKSDEEVLAARREQQQASA
ncbi:MAG: cysteine dioxygenase [Planctomycetota bacterium]|jgi:cysteine dioxygenase